MSKYTTQLRWIIESLANDNTLSIYEKIDKTLPLIFNFEYPIWSEDYRRTLERKIVMKYITKEICCETFGLWKLFLNQRLNEIMPLYNEMYEVSSKKFDIFVDIDNTENADNVGNTSANSISNNNATDKSDTTSNDTSNNKTLNSDLPQANYSNLDYGNSLTEFEGDNNVNTISNSNSQTSGTTENTSNSTNKYTKIVNGLSGSHTKTQLLVEYRNSLINIDKLIIDELYDLFMLVY